MSQPGREERRCNMTDPKEVPPRESGWTLILSSIHSTLNGLLKTIMLVLFLLIRWLRDEQISASIKQWNWEEICLGILGKRNQCLSECTLFLPFLFYFIYFLLFPTYGLWVKQMKPVALTAGFHLRTIGESWVKLWGEHWGRKLLGFWWQTLLVHLSAWSLASACLFKVEK